MIRKVRMRTLALAAAAACAVSVAACGGSGSSQGASPNGGPATVTMGVSPYVGNAPLYLGIKKGFFTQHGINLRLVSTASPPAILQAVVAQQDDLGFAVVPSLVIAASKGAPVRCVAPFSGTVSTDPKELSTGIVVAKNSPIHSPKDLAGKKVAVAALGGQQAIQTQAIVDKDGGNWKSVTLVPLTFPSMNSALKNGNVDAIATTSPFLEQAVAAGGQVLSWMESELAPDWSEVCSVANTSFTSAHPDLLKDYQAAMAESLDYAKAHVAEARATLPESAGVPANATATTPLGVDYDSKLNVDSIREFEQMMVKYGYIKSVPPNSQVFDYPGA